MSQKYNKNVGVKGKKTKHQIKKNINKKSVFWQI